MILKCCNERRQACEGLKIFCPSKKMHMRSSTLSTGRGAAAARCEAGLVDDALNEVTSVVLRNACNQTVTILDVVDHSRQYRKDVVC